ncbi:guanylate cyclase, putative [Bodo saltans]|uniref:Guanylate cyclase, putative n=1 Tax=Bodo saltans TaxID=75058 RepID=A0A0S4JAD2_BODSA|nr:guanylate cyclase, putative [Bodo saltans]|eukprot:CUG87088.1 guanylate cyclase, putative [Bodo saltans]
MKRHPVRLPRADPTNEHQNELFPRDLFHPVPAELAASPNRVQVLLGEQSELMRNSQIQVSNARGYLRSPPRRLRVIQDGTGELAARQATTPGAAATTDMESPSGAAIGSHRRPLPPISLPAELLTATNGSQQPHSHTVASLESISSQLEAFLQDHPNMTRKDVMTSLLGTEDDLYQPSPSRQQPQALSDSSLGSMPSSNVSTAFGNVVSQCLPHVPRIVVKNVANFNSASSGDGDDSNDDQEEAASMMHNVSTTATPTFVPWEGQAALLFVDISGYSKVTAALAPFGPYALSDAVNGYLVQMMDVLVDQYGGDVVKFAGDAILVVWAPNLTKKKSNATATTEQKMKEALYMCCLRAVACATTLQQKHSRFAVAVPTTAQTSTAPPTPALEFSIHIGIAVGSIETEVFSFPGAQFTESLFHSLSGPALREVGPAADAATSGEVCVTTSVVELLTDDKLHAAASGGKLSLPRPSLNTAVITGAVARNHNHEHLRKLSSFDVKTANDQIALHRIKRQIDEAEYAIEETEMLQRISSKFVPPALVARFSSTATNIAAEMRFLAVLFISKSDRDASLADWFSEVHQVLDRHRCAVVKLIDDDKGVHVIAAVGLFLSESDASLTAVDAAMHLAEREAGCHVGIASGLTFCGLIGSSDLACRWDVTGSACVRSCRLMQQAMELRPEGGCFVDESVLDTISNRAAVNEFHRTLEVKGSSGPVKVYVLAPRTANPAWMVPNSTPALMISTLCHPEVREKFAELISAGSTRHARRSSSIAGARRESLLNHGSSSSANFTLQQSSSVGVPPVDSSVFFRHTAAVVTGPFGVGKRTLAATIAMENAYIVIQHKCSTPAGSSTSKQHRGGGNTAAGGGALSADANAPPLVIAETLSRWFAHHRSEAVRTLAASIGASFTAGHVGKTRRLLLSLVNRLCNAAAADTSSSSSASAAGTLCNTNTLLLIENAQYLDRPSLDWIRHLLRQQPSEVTSATQPRGSFACVLCVTPTIGSMTASQLLGILRLPMEHESQLTRDHIATSTELFSLEPVGVDAVRDLATKYFSWDVDDSLFQLLHAQCSGLPLLVSRYVRHVMSQRPYVTTMFENAVVHLSGDAARIKAESWQWIDMAPSVAPEMMQLYDAASSSAHRAILRVIACLEQSPCASLRASHGSDTAGNDEGSVLLDLVDHITRMLLRTTVNQTDAVIAAAFKRHVEELSRVHLVSVCTFPCSSCAATQPLRLVRLSSVALQNAIYNSITPDYAANVLRLAKQYHEHALRQPPPTQQQPHQTGFCRAFLTLRLAQYKFSAYVANQRLASRANVMSPGTTTTPSVGGVPSGGFAEIESISTLLETVVHRITSLCPAGGHSQQLSPFDGPAQLLRRMLAAATGDEAAVMASGGSVASTNLPLARPNNISLDVVALKNYSPPIGLGTATASVVLDLCRWMRNVYVSLANRSVVSEKVAGLGRILSRRLATCLKALSRILANIQPQPHPILSDTHSASLSSKAINEHEALLNTIFSDLFLKVVRDESSGAAAGAEACKQLLQYFMQKLVPCALAFQEAIPELLPLLPTPATVMNNPTQKSIPTSSSSSAALNSVTAQMFALWSGVSVYLSTSTNVSHQQPGKSGGGGDGGGGGESQEADASGGGSIATFHAAFMALATSNFMPNNPRASLAWVRERVLHLRVESGRSFRSCVVSDYLCTLAAVSAMQSRQPGPSS